MVGGLNVQALMLAMGAAVFFKKTPTGSGMNA